MLKFDPNHPLGLPEGSVRALLVLMLLAAFLYLCVSGGTVPPALEELVKWGAGGYGVTRLGNQLLKAQAPNPPGPPAQGDGG